MSGNTLKTMSERVAERLVAAVALVLCLLPIAWAQDSGSFEIEAGELELVDDVFFLDAKASLELSSQARDALDSGLTLSIRYELEFLNRLRLWWDTEEATLRQRYQLEYHALTERYRVTNVNTGDQVMFADLGGALDFVGRIEDLPAIDAAVLDADRRYDVRLRVLLDTERLPGPLRLIAFWRRDWSIGSDWMTWRLDEE